MLVRDSSYSQICPDWTSHHRGLAVADQQTRARQGAELVSSGSYAKQMTIRQRQLEATRMAIEALSAHMIDGENGTGMSFNVERLLELISDDQTEQDLINLVMGYQNLTAIVLAFFEDRTGTPRRELLQQIAAFLARWEDES
ncbi:hypothetical protein [Nocardia pseudovaccinii]|uniref:hypothetical protein n=1 Tax=Nocardia pseudovaccinii TaxID=189540 RepID=UPI0012F508E6|nr:hypothetical protein [Nocardia pseudovaccinii]